MILLEIPDRKSLLNFSYSSKYQWALFSGKRHVFIASATGQEIMYRDSGIQEKIRLLLSIQRDDALALCIGARRGFIHARYWSGALAFTRQLSAIYRVADQMKEAVGAWKMLFQAHLDCRAWDEALVSATNLCRYVDTGRTNVPFGLLTAQSPIHSSDWVNLPAEIQNWTKAALEVWKTLSQVILENEVWDIAPVSILNLSVCYAKAGQMGEAVGAWRTLFQALVQHHAWDEAEYTADMLSLLCGQEGHMEEAVGVWRTLLEAHINFQVWDKATFTAQCLSHCYTKAEQMEEAVGVWRTLLEAHIKFQVWDKATFAAQHLINFYTEAGQMQKAVGVWQTLHSAQETEQTDDGIALCKT